MTLGNSTDLAPPLADLQGVVERLTFHSDESGYTVARVKVPRERDLITIVGSFANIQAGQTLQMSGFWKEHPKFGQQFQVKTYRETKPATLTGIEKYLGSGLIKGVGPVTAKRIVAHFGLETLDIIENQIERLIEVPGIAKKRVKMIQTTWEDPESYQGRDAFLARSWRLYHLRRQNLQAVRRRVHHHRHAESLPTSHRHLRDRLCHSRRHRSQHWHRAALRISLP